MTEKRSCFLATGIALAGVLAFVFAACLYYYFVVAPRTLAQKRLVYSPPTVVVYSPKAGDTLQPGATLLAQAGVFSNDPISRVEIWLDGRLANTGAPDFPDQKTFYPSFTLEINEGVHMVYWRAVDSRGLVEQSTPTAVTGGQSLAGPETQTLVTKQGESLEGIAGANRLDPRLLQDLNPSLGTGPLATGTTVVVPAPADPGAGALPAGAGNVPTPPFPAPPEGLAALSPAQAAMIDVAPLIPGLLRSLPTGPAHLSAGFERCWIRLMWDDQATNEDSFVVWMQRLGGPPQNIQTLEARSGTGIAWYDFRAPSFGIYSFWVEAANALGAQPSEIQWVAVNQDCGAGVATQLELHMARIWGFAGNGWSNPYCYLSSEGWPEKRFPEDPNSFLQVDVAGTTDMNVVVVDMPADDVLSLAGDCWASPGPASMGTFSVDVPRQQWDNRLLHVSAPGYVIDYRIRPRGMGFGPAWGVYSYLDYGIDPPHMDKIEHHAPATDTAGDYLPAYHPTISWWWGGDAPVTGFSVYVDGLTLAETPLSLIGGGNPHYEYDGHLFPTACGGTYKVQVAANVAAARSLLSEPMAYVQPPCPSSAEVAIDSFRFTWIKPEDKNSAECDHAAIEADVVVNDIFYGFAPTQMTCGVEYHLSDLAIAHHRGIAVDGYLFRVPLDPDNPYVQIKATWWRDGDQFVAWYEKTIRIAPEEWETYRQDFSESQFDVRGEAVLNYRITVVRAP